MCRTRPSGSPGKVGPVGAQGLPIAIRLLRASAQLPPEPLAGAAFLGELSLDGALRHTPGMLPMVMVAADTWSGHRRTLGWRPVRPRRPRPACNYVTRPLAIPVLSVRLEPSLPLA
jgi:Subunit ChlI of Mg-chelatase